jgi:AcrR family transcriptional regulator
MPSTARLPLDAPQPRRRDARVNRERLLIEARTLIARHGVDASLEEISRSAEVGVATLYRNFPTRDDLIRALYERSIADLAPVRDEIAAAPSAFAGVELYLQRVAEWLVADPSLPPILKRMSALGTVNQPELAFNTFIGGLVSQAKADGDLRADVEAVDLALLVTVVGSLGQLGDVYAGQWRRQLALAIDGLRGQANPHPKLPGRPLAARTFRTTVHGVTRARGSARTQ